MPGAKGDGPVREFECGFVVTTFFGQHPGEVVERIGRIASALVAVFDYEGYNVLCNNGRAAGQLVEHLHFHIIGRNTGDGVFNRWPSYEYPEGRLGQIAAEIRKNI